MAARILVKKNLNGLWQWRMASEADTEFDNTYYTGDLNLLAESIAGASVYLILPGQKITTCEIEAEAKDRRLFAKLVPFQIEENIIDSVDDMVFAYGDINDNQLSLAYVGFDYAQSAIAELEDAGAEVAHCSIEYLELNYEANSWSIVLDDDIVMFKYGAQLGFSVEVKMASLFVQAMVQNGEAPSIINVIAHDEQGVCDVMDLLPQQYKDDELITITEQYGCFWDAISTDPKPVLELRTGSLARKLPFELWWKHWQVPAIAAAVAFCVSVGSLWFEVKQLRKEQSELFTQRNDIYRQVVPKGAIADPVRQLQSRLKGSNKTEPSRLMAMMEKIAKPIAADKNLKLNSFRYSHKSKQLQLNLEAKEFAQLEALRKSLAEAGLTVDIKRSSANGDVHQAQMRVSQS